MKNYLKRFLIVVISSLATIGFLYMLNSVPSIVMYHNIISIKNTCEKGNTLDKKCDNYNKEKDTLSEKKISSLDVYKRDSIIAKENLLDCLQIFIIFLLLEIVLHLTIKKEKLKNILLPMIGILIFGFFYNYAISPILFTSGLLLMAIIYKKCFLVEDLKKKILFTLILVVGYALIVYIINTVIFMIVNKQPILEAYSYTLGFLDYLLFSAILLLATVFIKIYMNSKQKERV